MSENSNIVESAFLCEKGFANFVASSDDIDFKGAKVYLCKDYPKDVKSIIVSVLKDEGATIQKALNKNTKYYIVDSLSTMPINSEEQELILSGQFNVRIASVEQFFRKIVKTIHNASLQEKQEMAKKIFDRAIKSLTSDTTYSEYIIADGMIELPSCMKDDSVDKRNDYDMTDAWAFVHEILSSDSYRHYFVGDILSEFENARETILNKGRLYLDDYVNGLLYLLIAVALFIFGSTETTAYMEFVRDKWELRGDYRSSYWLRWEISEEMSEGVFTKSKKRAYNM